MSPPAPRRPSARRAFSTEQVAVTALRVLDERGAAGLSVRSVATELGINPNALYTYVRSREDLERLVVERVLAEVPPRPTRGTWQARIRSLCLDVHAALVRHPGAARLFMNAPMGGPRAMELGERLLRELTRAGLPAAQASRAAYTLVVQVIGFAALAMAETDGTTPLSPEAERIAGRRALLELVPSESHPLTAATRDTAAAWVGEAQLRWSVDRLVEGFAALADPQ